MTQVDAGSAAVHDAETDTAFYWVQYLRTLDIRFYHEDHDSYVSVKS